MLLSSVPCSYVNGCGAGEGEKDQGKPQHGWAQGLGLLVRGDVHLFFFFFLEHTFFLSFWDWK